MFLQRWSLCLITLTFIWLSFCIHEHMHCAATNESAEFYIEIELEKK